MAGARPESGTVGYLADVTFRISTVLAAAALAITAAACANRAADTSSVAAVDADPVITEGSGPATTADSTTTSTTATTTPTTTSTSTSTTTTSTTTSTSTSTTTTLPPPPGVLGLNEEVVGLGYSVEGRPIFAERYGTPGGRRVLVIGAIHGDEDDGLAIVDELRRRTVPDGVELWIVESMNPDGVANQDRHNANQVDLNRNFPYKWGPIGVPGDGQYAGTGPASEPETQAMINFMQQLQPDITLWYHQDLFVVNPSQGREGRIRARYAELTGLPMGEITGGTYTGIAATWARNEFRPTDGVAFIVELGPTLSPQEAAVHADAVLTIATEG
jgi:murein peptide amidase A